VLRGAGRPPRVGGDSTARPGPVELLYLPAPATLCWIRPGRGARSVVGPSKQCMGQWAWATQTRPSVGAASCSPRAPASTRASRPPLQGARGAGVSSIMRRSRVPPDVPRPGRAGFARVGPVTGEVQGQSARLEADGDDPGRAGRQPFGAGSPSHGAMGDTGHYLASASGDLRPLPLDPLLAA
jgi:hypothetical protein